MNTILNKTIGWILFLFGLMIIFYSLYSSYNIFTAKKTVPEIFKIEKEEVSVQSAQSAKQTKNQDIQAQVEKMISQQIGEQLKGILPVDFLPKLLNLISWSIFAGILILAGGHISSLGIKLIKTT